MGVQPHPTVSRNQPCQKDLEEYCRLFVGRSKPGDYQKQENTVLWEETAKDSEEVVQ